MSYTFAIALSPVPADDDTAWAELDARIEKQGPRPEAFVRLHDALTAKFPCIMTLSDDELDNGVWSDGPLINNFGHEVAVLGLVYSAVGTAMPEIVETALDHGMTLFDWQLGRVFRPS